MAKAAAELAISQPAVSKAIADMEHTLGLRLLDRGRSGIEPTAYGRALAKRGLAVFDELKHGVEELAFLATRPRASCASAAPKALRPVAAGRHRALLARASSRSPRRGASGDQHLALSRVARAQRRSLLGRIPTPFAEDDLETDIVYDDQLVVVAGRQSKWARARRLKLADLAGEAWILPPADTLPGSLAAELFRAGGAELPRAPVTTLSMHLCCRLAATGRFVTTLPTSILRFGGRDLSLKVLPIRLPLQPRPVGIVTLKNRTLSPVAKLFIECVHRLATPNTKRLAS